MSAATGNQALGARAFCGAASKRDGDLFVAVKAPAKVNLALAVGRRALGATLHEVKSVMAALSLCDTVVIAKAKELELVCYPDLSIPPQQNLVWRAASALAHALGVDPAVRIFVVKAIPSQAGLGGGSSDAAATLVGLCALWGLEASDERVIRVARQLGADVPFFLGPTPALMGNKGEVFEARLPLPPGALALMRPVGEGVATARAYRCFDGYSAKAAFAPAAVEPVINALTAQDSSALGRALANDLGPAALALKPQLSSLWAWLAAQRAVRGVAVCGSGSALFGLCGGLGEARQVAQAARARGLWATACRFISYERLSCTIHSGSHKSLRLGEGSHTQRGLFWENPL